MTPDPDRELIQRLQGGEATAFDELMARYRQPVLAFVFRMLNDAHEAEDVAQDVFVRVFQNVAKFSPRARFSTWLFQIARNAALDRARRQAHADGGKKFQSLELSEEKVPTIGKTAADELHVADIGRRIAAAAAELPEDQRTALVLAEYEGLSYADIAAIMKTTEKSVELRIYRARQHMRKALADLR